ncbi:tyrosine-type recombinase/integrase [Enterocloster bolteae]|uniref:tyrosine-type recombinase/integrase n=1 Tax=Enterocloster bolteae TaxID=208479 RepID=UPI00210EC106|nr:tyrosine-type recombinase/integrase [Enterocloster bolteae]MCQ5144528.1 tyrosine-type recombinase/integrase [Enterocloster bolteae]
MEDRIYYRELECCQNAPESIVRMIGRQDFYDLSALPEEAMKKEFADYIRERGRQVSLNTIQHDKSYFMQCCAFLMTLRRCPKSLLEWDEKKWVQMLKGWMLQNGIAITREKINIYGTRQVVDARLIGYMRRLIRFLQPDDLRPEQEKDIWRLDKLDLAIEENPIYKTDTINFTGIRQTGIREEAKQAIYLHLKYEKLGTVKREMTSLRQFSKYLEEQHKELNSCAEIDRALLEEYLIHKATNGSSGRGNSDDILKLRSVLESIGKIYEYPHLEKLFLSTDIPPEIQPEFKTYSDAEMKRLNAHITKLDEQITRCLVIHQMLGTRISDTLTLQRNCLSRPNGVDMITIQQVKTKTFQKPVSAGLAALIKKAIAYTEANYGETTYIFVNERDNSRPLQYTTIKHKVLGLIQKEDLRDDEGNPFKFGTHMFRRTYGVKLTDMHLDDWTIAKLLGHKGVHAVMHYRKMSNQFLADETRKAREEQTRTLLEHLDGWGGEYEQIR